MSTMPSPTGGSRFPAEPSGRASARPLVSVGIPVYNGERTLAAAIESALAQTYTNLEIIICDNCSTDKTREICWTYVPSDGRIRYRRCATHSDSAANFLRVLALARGEFFLWMCADDIRPPRSIENLMAAILRRPDAVMAHGPIVAKAVQSTKLIANRMSLSSHDAKERIRAFVRGFEHNAMIYGLYRTAMLRRARFQLHYGRDLHLCLQMCLLGPVEYSSDPMIILDERSSHPAPDPMGAGRELTMHNVLRGSKVDCKVWTTLLYGCRYLLAQSDARPSTRLVWLGIFGSGFMARYRRRLLSDAVLMAGYVFGQLQAWVWSFARQSSLLLAIVRRVKAPGAGA